MISKEQKRRVFKFFLCSGFLLIAACIGLCGWIKTHEQEFLQQVRQVKAAGCHKKIKINRQPLIPQFSSQEQCHE